MRAFAVPLHKGWLLFLTPTQVDSEDLLQQTAECQEAQLNFRGAGDIWPHLATAEDEGILNSLQLNEIAATLKVCPAACFQVRGSVNLQC